MSVKKQVSGRFKSKGTNILHTGKDKPDSMHEFLLKDNKRRPRLLDNETHTNTQSHITTNTQIHKNTLAHNHEYTNTQKLDDETKSSPVKTNEPETLERIHVQIRKDLADKLIEMVYARKREKNLKRRDATQRHIIEQALEEYFEKEGI